MSRPTHHYTQTHTIKFLVVCTLSFSLDYPILIAPSVFSNVYLPADIGEEDPSLGVGIPVVLVLSVVSLSTVLPLMYYTVDISIRLCLHVTLYYTHCAPMILV
jgi:hypothetical protein